jgi:hypothetical protein
MKSAVFNNQKINSASGPLLTDFIILCILVFAVFWLTFNLQLQTKLQQQTFVFMIFVMGVGTTIKDFHCCHVAFSLFVCCSLKVHLYSKFMVANLKLDSSSVLLVWVPTLLPCC